LFNHIYQQHLVTAKLSDLRPTQVTVGYEEVKEKKIEWRELTKKERKRRLHNHVFPCVLGPKNQYYVIDHHHLGVALLEEGIATGWVAVIDNLSWLATPIFWRTLEFRSWAHPYDEKGHRVEFENIPKRLRLLRNDPYRSLAGLVRRAGGFAKVDAPFAEFLWADFFRANLSTALLKDSMRKALRRGIKLARQAEARYLPGWSGDSHPGNNRIGELLK
jgi:hypothetical protein